jgi:hypothetical protein
LPAALRAIFILPTPNVLAPRFNKPKFGLFYFLIFCIFSFERINPVNSHFKETVMRRFISRRYSIRMFPNLIGLFILFVMSVSLFAQDPDAKGPVRSLSTNPQTDEKGRVNSLTGNLSSLGSVWQVTECCGWSGTWTRRTNTNIFDAVWRHTNGAGATGVVELKSWNSITNEVVLYRQSMNGYYKAFYNPSQRTLKNGTTTWYPAGQGWSAVIR